MDSVNLVVKWVSEGGAGCNNQLTLTCPIDILSRSLKVPLLVVVFLVTSIVSVPATGRSTGSNRRLATTNIPNTENPKYEMNV